MLGYCLYYYLSHILACKDNYILYHIYNNYLYMHSFLPLRGRCFEIFVFLPGKIYFCLFVSTFSWLNNPAYIRHHDFILSSSYRKVLFGYEPSDIMAFRTYHSTVLYRPISLHHDTFITLSSKEGYLQECQNGIMVKSTCSNWPSLG